MQNIIKVLLPRQLFLLLVLSTGLLNHVILIPNLLSAAGRDSWIGVMVAYPIAIGFLWLIYYIVKNSPPDGFYSMLRQRLGKMVSIMLALPVMLFLFSSSYVTLRDLMIWLNAYFLSDSSILMITVVLIIACFITTLSGVKYMALASGFLLPSVVLLGIFISLTNTTLKDPNLLFPILVDGYTPVFKGVIYTLSGLLEIFVVILLQPFSQKPIKFRQLLILLTAFTGLILGPLTASLMEFGLMESVNYRYPAFEQWRVLGIGEYISHLDFFALYQWLSGALIRIGLFMYLLGTFFTTKKKHYRLNPKLVSLLYVLLFSAMLINVQTHSFFEYVYLYFLPACLAFFLFQILLSAFILLVFKKRGEQHGNTREIESTS